MKPIWGSALKRVTKGNDSYTVILLHLDGADESTTFTDSSSGGHHFNPHATSQIDTAQSKFGVSSLLLDGNSDYISTSGHSDFNFGIAAFTIDFWVRFSATSGTQTFLSVYKDADEYYQVYLGGGNIVLDSSMVATTISVSGSWSPSTNTWYHIAVIRGWGGNANDFSICVDGVSVATATDDSGMFTGSDAEFWIGALPASPATNYFAGWIDEFRVSKGIARWTANFTPPPGPYW